jgi:CRISPR-associated protein (TIGR03986 family)
MAEGKIKWFNPSRGYGFIEQDEGGDAFLHVSEWRGPSGREPRDGERVTFDVVMESRGPAAKNCYPTGQKPRKTEGYRFLNPYNFVRPLSADSEAEPLLGRCEPPPHDRYVGRTGRIKCQLTVETPLFISDTHAVDVQTVGDGRKKKEHPVYRFFEYEGDKAIPASSLRGMLRSVFEAATNSCFSVFSGHKRLSYHLPPYEALKLVPARVIHQNGTWELEILNGTTPVIVGRKPDGPQYAAWVMQYSPLWRSRTRDRAPNTPYSRRKTVSLHGLEHGAECQALIEEVEHPIRRFRFWNVVEVAPLSAPPLSPRRSGQRRVTGYLCITNQNIENKHDERLFFCASGSPVRVPLPDRVRRHYRQLIEDYQERHEDDVKARRRRHKKDPRVPPPDQPEGRNAAFSRFILDKEEKKLKDGALVYAMLERTGRGSGRIAFIVPVSVPRVGYEQTIGDRLEPEGESPELHKCQAYDELCPACRVFGWVYGTGDPEEPELGSRERSAYAGRVRLTHGRAEQITGTFDATLAILSSPKPTTTRFYLRPIDGQPRDGLEGHQVDYSKGAQQQLRGRKVYRHQGDQLSEQEYASPQGKRTDQNRTVKGIVEPESTFEFELEFENLADVELGALLWALEMEGWHHRLGLAKPLGFGSVTIEVTGMEQLDPARRYAAFEAGWADVFGRKEECVRQFRAAMESRYGQRFDELANIQDLKALLEASPDLPVHYPRSSEHPQPDGKNFEWFVGNKRKGGPKIALPLATDDTEGLPLVDRSGKIV